MSEYVSLPKQVVEVMAGKLGAAVVILDKYAQANNQDPEIRGDMTYGRDSIHECLRLLVGDETCKKFIHEIEKRVAESQ